MFHFKTAKAELTVVAAMILENGTQEELQIIYDRLCRHITGEKPIDTQSWLERELHEEQQN